MPYKGRAIKYIFRLGVVLVALWTASATAHHSFAMFESEQKVWLTGKVIDYRFAQPHVTMKLEVVAEDGSTKVWVLETDNPKSWTQDTGRGHAYHPSGFVKVGETLTASGWVNRRGLPSMLISTLTNEQGVEFSIRTGISGQKSLPDPDDDEYLESLLEQLGSE